MSEPNQQPPPNPPSVEPSVELPTGPPVELSVGPRRPPATRGPVRSIAVVAVVALLLGIGGTVATFLLWEPISDRLDPPEYEYNVAIFLRPDVTDPQRDALRTALGGIDGVKYESREEAYRNFMEVYENSPDLAESVKPESLPESFQFETKGTNTEFDCGLLAPVKNLPGIDEISVTRFSKDDREHPIMRRGTCL